MTDSDNTPDIGVKSEAADDLPDILNTFTEGLKKLFNQTLHEPIPDSFLELLDRLDDQWELPDE